MPVALKQILPPTRSGRTFLFAAAFLVGGALSQLLVLAWCFGHGVPSARRTARGNGFAPLSKVVASSVATVPVPVIAAPTPVPAVRRSPAQVPPVPAPIADETSIPQEPEPAVPAFTRPTPAPAAAPLKNPQNLLEYARALRQRGDTNSALARLRGGLANEPNNPDLIAETALTYEAMQLPEKAAEQWQRVFDMGETIGALYYMADTKLHTAPGRPGAVAIGQTGGTGRDSQGFQDDAVLKITDLHTEDVTDDPNADKKTAMRIVVKAKPGVVIDPSKVKIETYFYDLLDGKDVVLTDAETSYKWMSEPVDWANDSSEILQTVYYRPRTEAAPQSPVAALAAPAPATPSPVPGGKSKRGKRSKSDELAYALAQSTPEPETPHVRIYLGYSVRLYYERQLQDVQADPIRLLQQFPPPLTLPTDDGNQTPPNESSRRLFQ